MPAAKSPISLFHEEIRQYAPLRATRVDVLLGKDQLAATAAPRRLVMWPTMGTFAAPNVGARRNSAEPPLAELALNMVALIWAESYDEAWAILERFYQAIHAQTAAGGPRYLGGTSEDTSGDDTSLQGETIGVRFQLVLPLPRVASRSATLETVEATVTNDVETRTITIT